MKKVIVSIFVLQVFAFACKPVLPKKDVFTISVLGDMPYNIPGDYLRFDTLIKKVNADSSKFTVFLGDFKSSQTPCSDSAFQIMNTYFGKFTKPFVYIPGDNEWTDCGNPNAGSYDPNERLTRIRKVFYSENIDRRHKELNLVSQSILPDYIKYKENLIWKYKGMCFASLHIVGSNNHFNSKDDTLNIEYNERNAANLFWLKSAFEIALEENSPGLVIFMHADIFTADKGYSGFVSFLHEFKKQCSEYNKPVLVVNGDSHKFVYDTPIGKVLPNLKRMQVAGADDMRAFKIKFDLNSEKVWEIDSLGIR